MSSLKYFGILATETGVPDIADTTDQVIDNVKNKNFNKVLEIIGNYFEKFWNAYGDNIISYLWKIVFAIVIYLIGKRIVKALSNVAERAFERSKLDVSVSKFLAKLISVALNMVVIISIIGILDIPTSSFIALIGSAGLAIGLSLQGSLQNFAGGVMILILKPFRVNDYIIANGIEGKVQSIDIFYTKLATPDNKKIVIPNGELSNTSIQNVPNSATRRLDIIVPVEYTEDIKKVKNVLRDIADRQELIKHKKGIDIFVDELAASSINMGFRVWVSTADYWNVRWDILETIIYRFREENINIPFDQLDITIRKEQEEQL